MSLPGCHVSTIAVGSDNGTLTVGYECEKNSGVHDDATCEDRISSRWEILGGELRINASSLAQIEANEAAAHCFDVIELECNELREVDAKWMRHATRVRLGSNKLSTFTCHTEMNAQMLDLGQNSLTAFHMPAPLPHLHTLILYNNRLKTLPSVLFQCPTLTHLDASHNRLTCLPSNMVDCSTLINVKLNHNRLRELPLHMDRMSLQTLDIRDNPLLSVTRPLHCQHLWVDVLYSGLMLSSVEQVHCNKDIALDVFKTPIGYGSLWCADGTNVLVDAIHLGLQEDANATVLGNQPDFWSKVQNLHVCIKKLIMRAMCVQTDVRRVMSRTSNAFANEDDHTISSIFKPGDIEPAFQQTRDTVVTKLVPDIAMSPETLDNAAKREMIDVHMEMYQVYVSGVCSKKEPIGKWHQWPPLSVAFPDAFGMKERMYMLQVASYGTGHVVDLLVRAVTKAKLADVDDQIATLFGTEEAKPIENRWALVHLCVMWLINQLRITMPLVRADNVVLRPLRAASMAL